MAIINRLSNSYSGITHKAARALYTNCIRPNLTYGAEVWHQQGDHAAWKSMETLQSQALRNVTGAYRGSSSHKVNRIANVEPLGTFLNHLQGAWAARAVRSGNHHIRAFLEAPPSPQHHLWHDGTSPIPTLDSPICRVFHASDAPSEATLSYGDSNDHRSSSCLDLYIFDPA